MAYLGSWKINDYLTFACNTHDPTADAAATDADSVPTYRVYEDETGTAITNGSMAKLDDASTTGFYSEQVQLLAATGFEKGKCYTIYISATVSSIVGTMHHTFQIEAEVDANDISDTGTSLTAVPWNSAWDAEVESEVDDALGAGGADLTAIPWNSAWDAEVESEVDDALGAGGADLTAIPWNSAWDSEVESEVDDALATYDGPTNAEMEARTLAAASYFDPSTDDVNLSSTTIDEILDEVVEGSLTMRHILRILLAFVGGKALGADTTNPRFRDQADSKNRISMTADEDGNRSAVTVDGS